MEVFHSQNSLDRAHSRNNLDFCDKKFIFTAHKRSLWQGNIFAPVCHSVHRGGYLGRYTPSRYTPWVGTPLAGIHPPGRYTPSGRYSPPGQTQSHLGRYTPWAGTLPGRYTPQAGTPLRAGTPLAGTPTPWAGTPQPPPPSSACWEIRATSGRYASYWNAFLFTRSSKLFENQS